MAPEASFASPPVRAEEFARTAVFAVLVLSGCGGRSAEALSLYFPDYAVDLHTEFQRFFTAQQTEAYLARHYDAALGLDQRTRVSG